MGYFAGRSAPLGPVAADVVTAVFYNFAPSHVARALPAAWEFASPADALRAREASAVAALRRCGVTDDDAVRTAADLLAKAARSAPLDGRPLFAANRALPWPDDPVAQLWHASHPAARTTRRRARRGTRRQRHQRPRLQRPALRSPTGCRATSSCAAGSTTTTSGRRCADRWPRRGVLDDAVAR